MFQQIRENYYQLTSFKKRIIIISFLFFDSLILGLTYGNGTINLIDILLFGNLPNDLIWLMQILESISAGFLFIKMFF